MPLMSDQSLSAVYHGGKVVLDAPADWPEGTRLFVTPLAPPGSQSGNAEHVIIVGFGLAGRCVADLLDKINVTYTIVEKNPVTVVTQLALGRKIVSGNAASADTLMRAELTKASILALTIPDEEAVLEATALARRLHPNVYIIARTNYASKGMKASQLGADDVIKAEQAVALQFYDRLSRRLAHQAVEATS